MSEKRWSPTDCLPRSDEEARLLREAFGEPTLKAPQTRGATSDTVAVPACPGYAALKAEVARLQEALEWADAMIWPYIAMMERHNDGKPTGETSHLREILGPIRRAHKQAAPLSMRAERDGARALLGELVAAVRARDDAWIECDNDPRPETWSRRDSTEDRLQSVLRRAEAEAGETR